MKKQYFLLFLLCHFIGNSQIFNKLSTVKGLGDTYDFGGLKLQDGSILLKYYDKPKDSLYSELFLVKYNTKGDVVCRKPASFYSDSNYTVIEEFNFYQNVLYGFGKMYHYNADGSLDLYLVKLVLDPNTLTIVKNSVQTLYLNRTNQYGGYSEIGDDFPIVKNRKYFSNFIQIYDSAHMDDIYFFYACYYDFTTQQYIAKDMRATYPRNLFYNFNYDATHLYFYTIIGASTNSSNPKIPIDKVDYSLNFIDTLKLTNLTPQYAFSAQGFNVNRWESSDNSMVNFNLGTIYEKINNVWTSYNALYSYSIKDTSFQIDYILSKKVDSIYGFYDAKATQDVVYNSDLSYSYLTFMGVNRDRTKALMVYKVDNIGNILWGKKYTDTGQYSLYDYIISTPRIHTFLDAEGGLVVPFSAMNSSQTNSDTYMLWLDKDGNPKKISGNDLSNCALDTKKDPEEISIYPNPVQNVLKIESEYDAFVDIHSTDGKLWMQLHINKGVNSIPFAHIPKGIYIVKVSHNEYSKILKICKE